MHFPFFFSLSVAAINRGCGGAWLLSEEPPSHASKSRRVRWITMSFLTKRIIFLPHLRGEINKWVLCRGWSAEGWLVVASNVQRERETSGLVFTCAEIDGGWSCAHVDYCFSSQLLIVGQNLQRDQSLPSGRTHSSRGDVIEGFWSRNQLFPGWSLPCHWSQHFGNAAVSLVGLFRWRPPRSLQHASAVSVKQCSRAGHCSSNVSLTCSANRNQQASSQRRSLVRWFKCAD